MGGLTDIVEGEKAPAGDEKLEFTISVSKSTSGKLQIAFPEKVITLETCMKTLLVAATIIREHLKEKGSIKKVDPKVIEKLKE